MTAQQIITRNGKSIQIPAGYKSIEDYAKALDMNLVIATSKAYAKKPQFAVGVRASIAELAEFLA